jgi:signal transduction histidine kinase/CheY-like chemotaxis protein
MSTIDSAAARVPRSELRNWTLEVRTKAIWLGLVLLYGAAIGLAGAGALFHRPDQYLALSLLCFACAGATWVLTRKNSLAAGLMLTGGSTAAILLTVAWGQFAEGIYLLVIPVALAALIFGPAGGAALAALCTVTLALSAFAPDVASAPRLVAAATMWSVVGLVWVLTDSLLLAVRWAWSNYEQSEAVIARSREQQVKLSETVDDLRATNMQMARLNRLAQSLRQDAEEERRAKEQFVANVSHELRTPLNMIIGFCEMITNAPETYNARIPPALLADLGIVLRNSRHLSDLIDDVLDLSQIEAGRMALTKERTSIPEIIESAAIAVRPLIASKRLNLTVDAPDTLPLVFCDRTRIREVVLNLLSNAARFTERGGVTVRAWQEDADVVVSVADTGPGISEEDGKRLFQPFEQLDASLRRRHGGTGLGLSISKGFVELHEGKIWVESQHGQGTTFYFRLPVDPPMTLPLGAARWLNPYEPYEERSRASRAAPEAARPRLLLVERGHALQRLLLRYLDSVEVATVSDLAQAAEDLARTPAQAVIVNDEHVGESLERVSASGLLPYGIPAIVCSVPATDQAAGYPGASGYLVKPISREALLATLDAIGRPIRKVLIVDDEPDALQLFGRMLGEAGRGYRVSRASNGRQALQLMEHDRPDVILLDLVMPEMDGFQLLSRKRTDPAYADIPVILISARDPQGQPIISSGIAATSARGLSVQQLLAAIQALTAVLARSDLPVAPERNPAPAPAADPAPRAELPA